MRRGALAGTVAVAALGLAGGEADAATIKVKAPGDEYGVAGNCTLREAVEAANTNADFGGCVRKGGSNADVIALEGGTIYSFTIGGADDGNQVGDLDVGSRITFEVRGQGRAEIDPNDLDRAIDVLPAGNLIASRLHITDGRPINNGFSYGGGAILNRGRLNLSRSLLDLNTAIDGQAVNGGAVDALGEQTRLTRVEIAGNTADNVGGGIAYRDGSMHVEKSVIAGNTGGGSGGGVTIGGSDENARVTVKDTTISGNTSVADFPNAGGGGIALSFFGEGLLKATNVTVSGNTAYAGGGGIHSYAGALRVNAATIASNTADFNGDSDGHGGGISGSAVLVRNSIIAQNEDAAAVDPVQQCFLAAAGPAHNLVETGGGCAEGGSNDAVVNPLLGPLADNGGPTPTHKLLKQSAAIGLAGDDAPRRDQRGVRRDDDPDSGAFER
jgi:CSLREA domain-containing protein